MRTIIGGRLVLNMLVLVVTGLVGIQCAQGCTRVVYLGPENTVVTGRTMDWPKDMGTNLWAFPRGVKRDSAAGPRSLHWTSKYGSVVASAFDVASCDGMNEKGLAANMLYLAESEYPTPGPDDKRRPLSVSVWLQYALDNYSSVEEAVAGLSKEPFYVVMVMTPDGKPGLVHLSLSDATGDSAILQYVGGKLVIYHDRQYQVMTNSPTFDKQLAINAYWKQIGGTTFLPGTNRSADRFVRASFYIHAIPQTSDNIEAVAGVFSVIRNVSVPLGITTPGEPNISSTLWRTVADNQDRRYYFESTRMPNVFWVNLADMDFKPEAPTKKLTLTTGAVFSGNTSAQFQEAKPFEFLPASTK